MDREILFRGKRIDNGEWVEGFLLKECNYATCSWNLGIEYKTDRFGRFAYEVAEITPETVGQFTGLTTKKGKKIFEGDVIECWSEGVKARGTVQQNLGGLWIIYPAWQKRIMWGLCPSEDRTADVEIIGNVHDHPELLEGGVEECG